MTPLALYVPGTTILHRMSAGWKLLALASFSIAILVLPGFYFPTIALALALTGLLRVKPPWRMIATPVWVTTVSAAVLATFHLVVNDWRLALDISSTLMTLVLAALLLTVTTRPTQIIDTLTRIAEPAAKMPGVKRTGFTAEKFALSVSIMLRALPAIFAIVTETRHAALARGLERSPRALIIPAVVRTVKYSQRTAEALAARGFD